MGQKSVGNDVTATPGRLIALLSACFIATHARVDPDLWGHLRFGLDALASGGLSITDPYSFTQDVPWVNHEWLSEVAQAIAYRAAGVPGLVLLKVVVLGAAFALLAKAVSGIAEEHRWWLLAAGIIGAAPGALTMRPQLWTFLFVPLLWHALSRLRRWPHEDGFGAQDRRWLAAVPILFAVWANLHGGWIVGIGVGGLWLIGRTIDRRAAVSKAVASGFSRTSGPPKGGLHIGAEAAALTAGVLATLINPYGWGLWRFLIATVRPSRDIGEWRPLWEQGEPSAAIVWLIIATVIVAPTLLRRRSSLTWAGALPVAWLGIMSLFVSRLVPLFGEVALLGFAAAWRPAVVSAPPPRPRRFWIVDAAAIATLAMVNLVSVTRCLAIRNDPWTPDLQAAAALDQAPEGRLVLPFNWGEYAIWHFGPRLRVSIDGRRETVYSARMLEIQAAAARGLPQGLEFLRQTQPEYVWLPSGTGAPAATWLKANGYRLDVETGRSFIATRGDVPPLHMGNPKSRCFP